MKKADLKKAMDAGTSVAYTERPGRNYPKSAQKATIVALQAKRVVSRSGGFQLRVVEDGVRLRLADAEASNPWSRPVVRLEGRRVIREENTSDIVVESREIVDAWDVYETKIAKIQDREQQARAKREGAWQRGADVITQLQGVGLKAYRSGYDIALPLADAEYLVSVLPNLKTDDR